ncbi:MAG: PorT family protein [Paludibacteraceae bacterium]|nr:PorT family protein [Paludibacteraceae bacterium]
MKRRLFNILLLLVIAVPLFAQGKQTTGMNNPYYDDKRVHLGFALGVNLMSYVVTESLIPQEGEIFHARVSNMLPGFSVGFITDVRLAKYLNLRVTPALQFSSRTITYKNESGNPFPYGRAPEQSLLSLPIEIPVTLKWTAMRTGNYRPYLTGGMGISYDFTNDKERPLLHRPFDYFLTVGLGCDFYLSWFKLCPEIRYQVGFNNMLTPISERPELSEPDYFYTNALSHLRNQAIIIIFNFE